MSEKVGFIGVGAMGSAIASRLVGHHELWVYDQRASAADELVTAGAKFAEVNEIVAGCTTVFLCLPGPTQVRELVLGEGGLASTLSEGAVLIDTSTSTPLLDKEVEAALTARGIAYVDSPIGGGVRRAREGTATLMVGAEPAVFERVAPLLRLVTSDVAHLGGTGTGHAMKLVNNLLNSCNRYAALEAVWLGRRCGIEQSKVVEVINSASGRNYTTEMSYTLLAQDDDTWLPQGFTLGLMLKDVHLANELADSLGHSTPIGHIVEGFTEQAIERFGPSADQSEFMAKWYGDPA